MANNNVQNVRFLRNGALFTSREQATNTLSGFTLTAEMDGSSILARYQEGSDPIKTLVGYVYYKDASNKSITIFDIDDAGADVDEKINGLRNEINNKLGNGITSANTATAQLTALSGTSSDASGVTSVWGAKAYADDLISTLDYGDTAVTGQYVSQVSEADGKIEVTRVALPTVGAISEAGKPITAVSESLGAISATAGTINAEYVNIADSGEKFTATTVEGALAEIATEIGAMDLAVVSGDGEVITAVSEEDGKVSASKSAIKDVKLTGYVKDATKTGAISATDDIEDALSKLENTIGSNAITNNDGSITVTPANGSTTDVKLHIKEGERVIKLDGEGGGIYTNLNLVEITGDTLPAEIKVRYELRDSDNVKIGKSIDIPKDSHIVSINYITGGTHAQNLEYVYIDVSGNTQTTYVDMSELVLEAEFESGVTATDGVVHGVVDPTSEKDESNVSFLTVGADGFKVSGIKDAIDTKINKLDAVVTGGTTAGTATSNHVQVIVGEADGKLTGVTVSETNIANASDLTQEISDRADADTELSNRLGANVTIANTASAQLSALSGTSADASGVTSVNGAKAYAKDYTDEKVATVVAGLDADVSGNSTHVTVGVQEEGGIITAVTVSESNIANDLTAEITARKAVDCQNGQTYAANANANYISEATSLNDADVKLDAALKSLSDATVNEVKVNDVALTEASNAVNVQISAAAGTGAETAAIAVNTDNSTGAVTISLLGLDCGTY